MSKSFVLLLLLCAQHLSFAFGAFAGPPAYTGVRGFANHWQLLAAAQMLQVIQIQITQL
jgi:hypothetical protein